MEIRNGKKMNNFQCVVFLSPSTPIFISGSLSHRCGHSVILCGSMSSLWQQLVFFWELLPSRRLCSDGGSLGRPASVFTFCLAKESQTGSSQRDRGKGRRSGKGTDGRGNRRLGGEKLNKQGNRCLNSFWLLSKAAVYLEQ